MNPFRLAWEHIRIGAMNEFQYRANFFIQLVHSAVALFTGLVAIALVYSHTSDLAGWTRPELLAVMGVHIALGGVVNSWIQPNMLRLMDDVRQGTFDFVLVKPADAQVLVSVREIRMWHVVDIVVGAIVLAVAIVQIQTAIGVAEAATFALTLVMGAVMIYCVWLIISSLAFRFIEIWGVVELFQGIYQAGRWPVTIYPLWLRGSLTFIVPLAFAITIPAEALSGRNSSVVILGAALFTGLLLAVTRVLWMANMRRYSGASA